MTVSPKKKKKMYLKLGRNLLIVLYMYDPLVACSFINSWCIDRSLFWEYSLLWVSWWLSNENSLDFRR